MNLYVAAACPDSRALFEYLTTRVAALSGVAQIETTPILRTVKRVGILPRG